MAISKDTQTNIDNSNLTAYPNGQVKDDSGTGDGFPLIRVTMSDIYEFFDKLMRLGSIPFNNSFDNETNGYQFVQACQALAAKSDFVLPLTTSSGVLSIPAKLGILQNGEKLLLKAVANWTSETTITGSDSPTVTKAFSSVPNFKAGDYLLLINNSSNVTFVRLVTKDNISVIAGENAFLQASDNTTELTGTAVNVATTPASNKYAFTQRVTIAANASPYYATDSTPGLLSAADKAKLDALSNVSNLGWASGIDVGGGTVGQSYTTSGNITSCISTVVSGGGISGQWRFTMQNAMLNTNYFVRIHIESQGTIDLDTNILCPVFKPISTTTFDIGIDQSTGGGTQSLKIHVEAVQLS